MFAVFCIQKQGGQLMAEKLQYIEELSLQTLKGLNKRENWINYLRTASNHYKYSFRDSFLIYAQRPDAIAVASYDLWNNVMHRYINRGSNGIALIDRRQGQPKLHYVFDISDTNGDRTPFIWKLKDDYFYRVNEDIADSFDLEDNSTPFDATIIILLIVWLKIVCLSCYLNYNMLKKIAF